VKAYMQDDFADRPVDKNDFAKSFYIRDNYAEK